MALKHHKVRSQSLRSDKRTELTGESMMRGMGIRTAAMVVLGVLAALWWIERAPSSRSTAPGQLSRTAAWHGPSVKSGDERGFRSEPASGAANDPTPTEPIAAADLTEPATRAIAADGLDRTLQIYRETMTYPLSSRPADGSNEHLTRWNRPISTGQPFAVDAAKREIQALATIDRIFAGPGQAVSVVVTTTYVADGLPAQIAEIGAEVQWRDRQANEWVTAQAVPLRGTADGWVGSVVPSQVEALHTQLREARIMAYVRDGEFAREFALDFAYTLEQPVVVRGIAFDRVVEGSLELGLDVELRTAAPVGLTATLFSGDGRAAIAVYDDRYFPARPGRQVIPVRFFGKILYDRKIDGPYWLGAIHGYVYRQGSTPDQLFFDHPHSAKLMTAVHPAAGFSPDGYQSPEVAARIAHYEALREAMRAGREPPPPPQPPYR